MTKIRESLLDMEFIQKRVHSCVQNAAYILVKVCSRLFDSNNFRIFALGSHANNASRIWQLCILFSICMLIAGAPKAYAAYESFMISSITASVSFSGNEPPRLSHVGLTQIPVDNYALIRATASCATTAGELTGIYINYYTSAQSGFSTATIVANNLDEQYFENSIAVDKTGSPDYFYYRMTVVDSGTKTGYWPPAGTFWAVGLESDLPPQIYHTPVTYVSAVTGIFVATGTVTDAVGLNNIVMYYKTDLDIDYSTYTLNVPAQSAPGKKPVSGSFVVRQAVSGGAPSKIYDFRFQLDESAVEFSKAKYFYYYLQATNSGGQVYSLPGNSAVYTVSIISSMTRDLGALGGSLILPNGNPEDGMTKLEIPVGALDGAVPITISELSPADGMVPNGKPPCASLRPLAVYSFGPEKLVFKKFVTMKLLFQDIDHDGVVDGTNYKTDSLKIFWWDGFDWRMIGGTNDPRLNTINYGKIKHFSMYAIFPANSMTDNDYRPKERIITPATADNKNDIATFDGLVDGDIVNIYDVTGRRIRQLEDDFSWDGKDEGGELVESGIYIYQIKLSDSGKIISGTTVVAK